MLRPLRTVALRTIALVWGVSLAAGVATRAFAQPAPQPAQPQPGAAQPGAGQPAAAPGADSSAAATAEPPKPQLPEVNDPMLAEIEPAKNVLKDWRQALAIVRADSTAIASTRTRTALAEAAWQQARAGYYPTLTAQSGVNYHILHGERTDMMGNTSTIPDPALTWGAELSLRVPVFAPREWYDARTAKEAIETTRFTTKNTERLALGAVADAIVSVVTAERLAEVSRVSMRSALSTLDLNKRRADLGAASAVDVVRAEQEVALSRAQVVGADDSLRAAREDLGIALGSAEPWGVPPDIQLDSLARDASSVCRSVPSVDTRADVKAAKSEIHTAERRVKSVDWAFWPTVDASSTLTYYPERTGVNNTHFTWTVGGVLTWRLYDGGVRYAEKKGALASLELSRLGVTDVQRQASVEVQRSMRNVRAAEANLAVSRQNRDLAEKSANLSKIAFLNGSGTSFDLVDSARRLREAELDLTIKEFQVVRAKIAALLALAECSV
jgi:outer membrane protein TolC